MSFRVQVFSDSSLPVTLATALYHGYDWDSPPQQAVNAKYANCKICFLPPQQQLWFFILFLKKTNCLCSFLKYQNLLNGF